MTAAVAGRRAPSRAWRDERWWVLAGHLALALMATVSLPLGARDGAGVSSILPPLRTTIHEIGPSTTAETELTAHDHGAPEAVRAVARALLPWPAATPRPASDPPPRPSADPRPADPPPGPPGSRGPPIVR